MANLSLLGPPISIEDGVIVEFPKGQSSAQNSSDRWQIVIGEIILTPNEVRRVKGFQERPDFATLEHWQGQPVLHRTGTELAEWSIDLWLHSDLTDPDAIVAQLQEIEVAGEAVAVSYQGRYDGEYVVALEIEERKRNRGILLIEATIDLRGTTTPEAIKDPKNARLNFESPWDSIARSGSIIAKKIPPALEVIQK